MAYVLMQFKLVNFKGIVVHGLCVNVQLIFCRWEKTHALLIEGGLTYNAIQNSVAKATIAFRDGVTELFELLEVQYSHYQLLFSETS